jgi:amino acid adenylation domain-containing protein
VEERYLGENRRRITGWNATEQSNAGACIHQLVTRWAAETPGALAVTAGARVLTYRELDASAEQLASLLRSVGIGPDMVVALCLEPSAGMIVAALAVLKAGGAYLPLDPEYPPDRLAFILKDAQSPIVVISPKLRERLPLDALGVVTVDHEGRVDAHNMCRRWLASPSPDVTPEDLAYVIYTSGSTGRPKGVEIRHESLMNLVSWHQHAFAVTPADKASQVAALGFDATVWELWPYLAAGASVHVADPSVRKEPRRLRDWLVAQGITISFVPTPMAERLMALEWPATAALRVMLTGADTLHDYPSRTLPFRVVNNYGPTECTVVATSGLVPPDERPDRLPPIGRPIDNTHIYILDEHLRLVPVGVPGELHIGGVGLARGYRHQPELTAEKFIPDPFDPDPRARLYKTGDLARYLPHGQIAFLGRIDEQIKVRGYRIEPSEVVATLKEHPAIREAVVVAQEVTPGDKHLVAYVALASGGDPTHRSLETFLRAHLPEYMVPTVFVRVDLLPLTPNGKVDRRALPPPNQTNTLRDTPFVAARTLVEARVARIVAPVLGLDEVSVNDNFFLLGGHSLLGTQLIARLSAAFGIELSLRNLFEAPTVAQLAAEVEHVLVAKLEGLNESDVQRLLSMAPRGQGV